MDGKYIWSKSLSPLELLHPCRGRLQDFLRQPILPNLQAVVVMAVWISGFAGGNVELSYTLENNGITLGTNDVVSSANGIVHGPYIVSDSAVSFEAGDSISFNWQGVGSGDAADVYAF